jgi:hypothetical protein
MDTNCRGEASGQVRYPNKTHKWPDASPTPTTFIQDNRFSSAASIVGAGRENDSISIKVPFASPTPTTEIQENQSARFVAWAKHSEA